MAPHKKGSLVFLVYTTPCSFYLNSPSSGLWPVIGQWHKKKLVLRTASEGNRATGQQGNRTTGEANVKSNCLFCFCCLLSLILGFCLFCAQRTALCFLSLFLYPCFYIDIYPCFVFVYPWFCFFGLFFFCLTRRTISPKGFITTDLPLIWLPLIFYQPS